MVRTLVAFASLPTATAHGWVTTPVSRLELSHSYWSSGMPDDVLRWSPQSSNGPNSCGAWDSDYTDSKDTWLHYYQVAGLDVPVWAPGTDVEMRVEITADHGGQAWVMLSCDDIAENASWTYLERATDDRDHHYLPSSPHIYAWPKDEIVQKHGSVLTSKWRVPSDFSCPGGRGVGRWVWKTGNTCNDDKNIDSKRTETFELSEFKVLNDAFSRVTMPSCTSGGFENEYFITCFDFSDGSTPSPGPSPSPTPTPPVKPVCCWSRWGALDGCGRYPDGAQGGLCNVDWTMTCTLDGDCSKELFL